MFNACIVSLNRPLALRVSGTPLMHFGSSTYQQVLNWKDEICGKIRMLSITTRMTEVTRNNWINEIYSITIQNHSYHLLLILFYILLLTSCRFYKIGKKLPSL